MKVTLSQLLDAKEKRAARQKNMAEMYGLTVISFTVLAVGEEKNTPLTRRIASQGEQAIKELFGSALTHSESYDEPTGYYMLAAVEGAPLDVKRQAVTLEDNHPLGRLFDVDVLDGGVPISRTCVGAKPRNCLLCGNVAAVCVREKTHSQQQLQQKIQEIANRFLQGNV